MRSSSESVRFGDPSRAPRSYHHLGTSRSRWSGRDDRPRGIPPRMRRMSTDLQSSIVPTKYWHALDDGRIQCDLCPRFCKLREGQRGLCFVRARAGRPGRPDDLRPLQRLLRRPDREEAAQPLPARHAGPVLRHGGLQPGLQVLPELGHLQVARDGHPGRRRLARRHRRGRRRLGCRSVAFTYNDPVIFHEYAIDVAAGLPGPGRQDRRGDRRLHLRPSPAPSSTATWMPPTSTSRRFTERFYHEVSAGQLAARCWRPSKYLKHETDVWFEMTTLLIPGQNDSDAELDAMTRWVVEHLGPDVPHALLRLPSRLRMMRHARHPARDPAPRPRIALGQRRPLRLRRQRPRPRGRQHLLPLAAARRSSGATGTS